jgi:hypothetical protein
LQCNGGFLCARKSVHNFKKTQIRYSEADEEKRILFKEELAEAQAANPEKSTYYVDETGVDKFLYRERVRAKRGVKVYNKIRGRKFERLSVVAGKSGDKIAAPMIYSGTADSLLFETWFEDCFCPEIAGNICVMDNATIHRKSRLFEIAKKYSVILIFQPAYSPDLNEIEKFWAWLKNKLRSVLRSFDNLMDALCYCFQLN